MPTRLIAALFLCALLLPAAKKPTVVSNHGENEDLMLTATLYFDPADIKELLGNDLGGHYIVVDVKVEPKYGKEVTVDLDDFVLRSNKDGEHSQPYVPSQVAGRNAMVVKRTNSGNSGVDTTPTYGGMPVPVGGIGYPSNGTAIGGGGGEGTSNQATVQVSHDESENPLEKTLESKILVRKKTEQPVSGLLYFPLEKQKMKDIELRYGDKSNRITLRFR